MTLSRFEGPGDGISLPLLRSGVRPEVAVSRVRSAVSSTGESAGGPKFGRFVAGGRVRYGYTLTYNGLTADESQELARQYADASLRGARALWYSPDDRSEPIEVHLVEAPGVVYGGPQNVTVTVRLEQQR